MGGRFERHRHWGKNETGTHVCRWVWKRDFSRALGNAEATLSDFSPYIGFYSKKTNYQKSIK